MPAVDPENVLRAFREPLPPPDPSPLWEDRLTPMEVDAQRVLRECQAELHGLLAKHRDAILAREHGIVEAMGLWVNAMAMGASSAGSWLRAFSLDTKEVAADRFVDELRDHLVGQFISGWDSYLDATPTTKPGASGEEGEEP